MKKVDFSNIAVLIDVENISSKFLQKIISRVAAFGEISVKRIYSDWTDNNKKGWRENIHEFSLVTIQQFNITDAKNVSDFALVIDAMDLLHDGVIDCFCIVSSDSDYTRLAQRIRENGKSVIGLGERKTNNVFVNACNEFIYLDDEAIVNEAQKSDSENISEENNAKNASNDIDKPDETQKHDSENISEENNVKDALINIDKPDETQKRDSENTSSENNVKYASNDIDKPDKTQKINKSRTMLISDAVDEIADDNGWALLAKITPYIKRIKPDFSIKNVRLVDNDGNVLKILKRLTDFFYFYNDFYELSSDNMYVRKRN